MQRLLQRGKAILCVPSGLNREQWIELLQGEFTVDITEWNNARGNSAISNTAGL